MSTGEESKQEVPEVEAAFTNLLKKFRVGLKDGMAETISEHIARTGGEEVFENPERLADRLVSWHDYINPVRRRQILEQWFAERGVEVPEETLRRAGAKSSEIKTTEEEQARKAAEEEKKKAKFYVDQDTGRIRAAREGEVTLTWDEAEKVSERITKDKAADEKGEKELPFITNEKGEWTINPKAKLSFSDIMVWDMFRKAKEKGEETDPFQIMKQKAQDMELMRSVFGGGEKGGGTSEIVDGLIKLKELTAPDKEMKAVLAGIYDLLEKGGGRGEESEVMKVLRGEVKDLRDQLTEQEKKRLTDQIDGLRTEITNIRGDLAATRREQGAKGEYDIMSQGLGVMDRRLGAVEGLLRGAIGKPPAQLSEGEKTALKDGITEEVTQQVEIDGLAKKVFYRQ